MILDGKYAASVLKERIKQAVVHLKQEGKRVPCLCAVLIGDHPASNIYVQAKIKACAEVGFTSTVLRLSADISALELLKKIEELNFNKAVDGFIIQLPLPAHLNTLAIIQAISPEKDVDGFHPENLGKIAINAPHFVPATPFGILELLRFYKIETAGKHCVVVGRSNIVGMPISILMSKDQEIGNCTVTLTHSQSKNLQKYTRDADILIVAMGKPHYITADMVKPKSVVIDVGITRIIDAQGKPQLFGDVDFANVFPLVSAISPVPFGVGPMTIYGLLHNTLKAYMDQSSFFV